PSHLMTRPHNCFSENIKKAKKEHWEEWLKAITPANIWDFHCYAASDPSEQIHTKIKTLKDLQDPNRMKTM
ncbi:hypothetical protein BDR04DRAFT_1032876, partial [Suillus decipiens]